METITCYNQNCQAPDDKSKCYSKEHRRPDLKRFGEYDVSERLPRECFDRLGRCQHIFP